MLGEDGQKMSKSKRNYREPNEIFDRYGADALRWYFFANQPPWTSIRYSEQAIKDSIPEFLLRLWNVYSFFVIYANDRRFDPAPAPCSGQVDQLTPAELAAARTFRPLAERGELGPLDPERIGPDRGSRDRTHGRLRQLCRLRPDHRLCRRPEQLVRAPQSRSFLDRRQADAATSWTRTGRCTNA